MSISSLHGITKLNILANQAALGLICRYIATVNTDGCLKQDVVFSSNTPSFSLTFEDQNSGSGAFKLRQIFTDFNVPETTGYFQFRTSFKGGDMK